MLALLGIRKLSSGKYEVQKHGGFYVAPDLTGALKIALFR